MNRHNFYKSKVFWFNMLLFLVASIELATRSFVFSEHELKVLLFIGAIVNLALRMFFYQDAPAVPDNIYFPANRAGEQKAELKQETPVDKARTHEVKCNLE